MAGEVQAVPGFNLIATANDRDRGINDLSAALRRRFNTVVLPLPADPAEGQRWGWWADGIEGVANDRIGSRLWLLAREKLTASTYVRAREYAEEALQWMLDDLVATAVVVLVERRGLNGMAMQVTIERDTAAPLQLRFDNAWSLLNV